MSKAQTAREIYFSESYYDRISADVSSKDFEDVYTFGFFLDPFCEFDSIIETPITINIHIIDIRQLS